MGVESYAVKHDGGCCRGSSTRRRSKTAHSFFAPFRGPSGHTRKSRVSVEETQVLRVPEKAGAQKQLLSIVNLEYIVSHGKQKKQAENAGFSDL